MCASTHSYRGRFAPSPTGPLHKGSLIAALASYLDARAHSGQWLVRIEDIDPPREQAGATQSILNSLQAHGLYWDDDPLFQSTRSDAYEHAITRLHTDGLTFACQCTRAALGPDGCCNGRCEASSTSLTPPTATRFRVERATVISTDDGVQGQQSWPLGQDAPDFVIKRKDGLFAYQLAVAVDDAQQGISRVVRGSDLLDSTPRQIALMGALGYDAPEYSHIPILATPDGQKLSKQNHAAPLADQTAAANLREALDYLGQPPPPTTLESPVDILTAATTQWSEAAIPKAMAIIA
ncbi:tRNA glutamyl-Q(34) synthetase GluQRS [Parahalioglobus pacificus]|uniref:Glutamyl-Q tRNA(Asp) synthetase n=1 Tax=Parahalioglobus pacificus TaxID=930806 RepID=A0A918XM38_9GAMM|nr:tRNA glutamyl-Q(34) synthetase GluQRS [Halioglobus pacificus]GHD37373.1 glutamyl-Q tRNA(Asp) synthetase [Halioglobus pacificus]